MTAREQQPQTLVGDGVTLLRLPSGATFDDIVDGYAGHRTASGWPHADTADALAFAGPGSVTWLVLDAGGAIVGEAGTKAGPDAGGAVEIGYGLAGPTRGRGLGTQAVSALIDWLGTEPDVQRIVAHVEPTNVASRRLLERLGFTVVAVVDDDELRYERDVG